ncbi:MAG TPA: LLM class F420-dependent oxidoreductase [Acidimicrobiia bacterium]|nr:LLM class F420-dependent oxidoreductase [Acidimicrobiia bacterium]
MKFGAFVPQGWRMDLVGVPVAEQWPTMLAVAGKIEDLGYDTAWVYDHFHTVPHATQESTFECWTLMAALAAATTRVRLGQMCTCNSYRNPAYMAKVASSVDVISGGRLEFAIGAGWYHQEYEAYGYEYPSDGTRLAQLEEAAQIILEMWTEDEATFEGNHYSVRGAINRPKPLQDPHPPLWIAGGGERKTLRMVAKYGDNSNTAGTVETFRQKNAIIDRHCAEVGRDPAEIGRTTHVFIAVADTETALQPVLERIGVQIDRPVDKFLASTQTVAGTTDQVVERLGEFKDAGCAHVVGYFADAVWGDSIDVFAEQVMPALSDER